jgi:hypothetical protein
MGAPAAAVRGGDERHDDEGSTTPTQARAVDPRRGLTLGPMPQNGWTFLLDLVATFP